MITLAIALALVFVYLWYGLARVAPTWAARETARDIKRFPVSSRNLDWIAHQRRVNAGFAIGVGLIWPAHLALRALTTSIARASERAQEHADHRNDHP
ncbi:hypothetical protein [Streptomonospora litoralis]|uniref:Uncharacterized protein n=1 Tax=Streptomonospora litoralis TaxID=2498135 RepID=A0A4P6QB89_9ACTN|nr:hypothetical protein [Streptomonospora litoralis]QBI56834.1 hypothetical protein EKD16_25470 [Streptomonospora litoralis]